MIHFDFIVSDEEGETIFTAISEAINHCQERADFGKFIYREGYLKHMAYLQALKAKMTNSKVS